MVKCEWYSPVCDEILAAFKYIYDNYDRGKPYATRLYIPVDDKTLTYENKVTISVHTLIIKQIHADHLLRILNTVIPKKVVTTELKNLPIKLRKNGKLIRGNSYAVDIALYRGYIREVVEALESVKNGTYGLSQLNDMIAEDKEKSPFEL